MPSTARFAGFGLGLGTVEEEIYLRLLGVPAADAEWLATRLHLRVVSVVAALTALSDQGLVEGSGDGNWAAVPPDVALEELLLRREVELRRARGRIGELMRTYRQGRPGTEAGELVEVISGRESIAELWRTLQLGARERLRILDRPPYVRRADPQTELSLLARGVSARVVYHSGVLRDPEQLAGIRTFTAAGEQARVHPELPLKLALLDDRYALLPVTAGTELQSVLLIRPSTLLDALAGLFELYWSHAMRLPAVPEETPEDRHRQLLTLLAAGLTDESIGRQLGVSTRTVQRLVRELMDRFGARTRFQAGIQAARADLL
ncbi:LuxR C-terminal-related transcriptional regulator [Kitasatospora sp. NPDC059722]|uniref:LuxR C-terminal-related transcriptional regulator n=1 Tax=unclassified Kitasatospora TaxID=2633591 RepID=UPI003653E073